VSFTLTLLDDRLAVSRLDAREPVPDWASKAPGLLSITRTAHELSLVTAASAVPAGGDVVAAAGWRAFALEGTFDFALTGVLVAILAPLAQAGIGIFAFSTYDTDHVMVREDDVDRAAASLRAAGHTVQGSQ
jgi:hypothetical protein